MPTENQIKYWESMKGGKNTEDENKKHSNTIKELYKKGVKMGFQKGHKIRSGMKHSDKSKDKLKVSHKGQHNSPETQFKQGYKFPKEIEQKRINSIKKNWQNEEYAKKMFKIFAIKPNKPELFLNELLQQNFPNSFKYVGDGKVWFDGFNPDFICNPSKKIIELFGIYWHNRKGMELRDKKRLETFAKYGYKTLVIWDTELKNNNQVIEKINNFIENPIAEAEAQENFCN